MAYVLELECIGDDTQGHAWQRSPHIRRLFGADMAALLSIPARRPWVAQITGLCPQYGLRRTFLSAKKDYARANSIGSRGVYRVYLLEEGPLYEVQALLSWKRSERYFCQIRLGEPWRLTWEEVVTCLSAALEPMS